MRGEEGLELWMLGECLCVCSVRFLLYFCSAQRVFHLLFLLDELVVLKIYGRLDTVKVREGHKALLRTYLRRQCNFEG
jgi:hypothetical protein